MRSCAPTFLELQRHMVSGRRTKNNNEVQYMILIIDFRHAYICATMA